MRRIEAVTRWLVEFFKGDLGRAAIALFSGVICFCFPWIPGCLCGAACLYYSIHQFRPIAMWIYSDIRSDLAEEFRTDAEP